MARDHARLKLSVWDSRDWRSLTIAGQHMYWTLISHKDLTYAGVMDWWPGRLASLSKDADEGHVYGAVKELQDARYVFLDTEESELLVRTYVRHDNILERANMGKACARAITKMHSLDLRDVLFHELAKLRLDKPMLAGWDGIKAENTTVYETVISMATAMRLESNQ
jgi:hypothetical protein